MKQTAVYELDEARRARAAVKELASRDSDGLEVTLLWYSRERVASVAVLDSRTGKAFELVLADGDDALDVFHHPYAYAAHRGLDYHVPARVPALALAA